MLSGEELVEKLVALIPPPRFHMTRAFGIWASHAKLRPQAIPRSAPRSASGSTCEHRHRDTEVKRPSGYAWAALMRRVLAIDVLTCDRCGSRMQKISVISQSAVIRAILAAVGRNTGPPPPALAPCPTQLPLRA